MAQVKLLKIAADGVPLEFNSAADEITLLTFSVTGGGPVMSGTGIDMNGQDVSDISDLVFTDPAVGTINQTAGSLIVDDIMAKERGNTLTTAADILFPVITDVSGQVDALRLPALAGPPTASPTASGEGFMVWDSTNDKLYIWDGAAWDDQSTVSAASAIQNVYTADEALSARDVVYISAADNVSKAQGLATSASYAMGFATTSAADTDPVVVQSEGVLAGFTGLTAGARYYLSAATAGLITSTIPTGSGNTVVQVGYAKSATALHIHIEQMGRRA
jgi:hypothetical protein